MNEYVIHAKVKNNLLLSRILGCAESVAAFCAEHGLSQNLVGELINMKSPAQRKSGKWRPLVTRLAFIFGCEEDDLFTEEQRTAELKTNEAFVEMSRQQALAMADPISLLEGSDLVEKILGYEWLNPREQAVLRLNFVEDKTLKEVAEMQNITIERVRQIRDKALRKLRHPNNRALHEAIE